MIEIVFSDSACGSLKAAQYYGKGKYQSGGICVLFSPADGRKPTKKEVEDAQRDAEEKERLAWESATPLGGNPTDVYGFNLALSVGNISENTLGSQRQQVLEHLYSIYPNDQGSQAAQDLLQRAKANLQTVYELAAAGEALRIWYSNGPDELCGLYWLMAQLNQLKERCWKVYLVKLPEWEAYDGNVVRKTGWGEVAPGEWHRYFALQKSASPVFCQSCASHWRALQKENAPLRAILNGQLVSVPETIYDDFIIREIAEEGIEFQEAMIVGRVLGKYQLGIGDSWVALRIEEMIRTGKLEPLTELAEDSPIYHRVLKKCNER